MTRSSIRLSIALAAIFASAQMASAATGCPNRLDGKFDAPLYRFTYESWLSAGRAPNSNLEYQFGGTIQNRGATTLWVDWKEMGVSGFIPPGEAADFKIGDPTGECDVVDADIWYGDRPFLLSRVSALRPQPKGFVPQLIQIVTSRILDYLKKDGKVFTASNSTLYIPLDQGPLPKELAEFQIQFTTEISKGDYKLGLTLIPNPDDRVKIKKYFEQKPDNAPLFTAVFDDPFISQGLRSNDLSYTKTNFDNEQPASVFQSVDLKEPQVAAYRTTRLVFEDAQRRRIATMPVAVLQPNLPSKSNR